MPRSLRETYSGASAKPVPSPTIAAWWQTASTPRSRSATTSGSRTSPPSSRTSRATLSWPRAASASTTWDPMNPAEPVTSTRMPTTLGRAGPGVGPRRPHVTAP